VPTVRRIPAVAQYYGHDEPSGRLVQVHAHRRLVFGDDMTKNFALDVEDDYIAAAVREPGTLAVASPEYELLLFVLRMVAKHCTVDAMGGGPEWRPRADLALERAISTASRDRRLAASVR
jgi:hypothetical protein